MMEMACFNAVFDILKPPDASIIHFEVRFLGLIRLSRTLCCDTFMLYGHEVGQVMTTNLLISLESTCC